MSMNWPMPTIIKPASFLLKHMHSGYQNVYKKKYQYTKWSILPPFPFAKTHWNFSLFLKSHYPETKSVVFNYFIQCQTFFHVMLFPLCCAPKTNQTTPIFAKQWRMYFQAPTLNIVKTRNPIYKQRQTKPKKKKKTCSSWRIVVLHNCLVPQPWMMKAKIDKLKQHKWSGWSTYTHTP
jgi:hypothetical protein